MQRRNGAKGLAAVSLVVTAVVLGGCSTVPTKIEVKDVSSGRVYQTYEDPRWAKENMLGFNFVDIDSGSTVMLKSYEKKVLKRGGFCKPGSPEELDYKADLERIRH